MSALEWFVVIASARSNAVMPYIVMVRLRGRAVRKIIAKMRERTQGRGSDRSTIAGVQKTGAAPGKE
jgi:hypothetical protein